MQKPLAAAALALLLAACEGTTGSEGGARLSVRFASAGPSLSALASSGGADELVLTGANGTLRITDVRFIVSEFKLERDESACEDDPIQASGGDDDDDDDDDDKDDEKDDDACEKFEAPPSFVDLPFAGGSVTAVAQAVPAGSYTEMKFEVEDVELDEIEEDDDEDGKEADLSALAAQVRAAFPDWPNEASMVVVGTFTPTGGGAARPFRAYFEAEIKVKKEFSPPLSVTNENRTVNVEVDPSRWFLSGGKVIDLSAFDFATTGRIVEFEAKMDDGFEKIEIEDEKDDD